MNVREIPSLRTIMGFDGEYAIFKAKDEKGNYQGIINRKGEVVWNDDLRLPIHKLRDHESVYFSMKRDTGKHVYYDVAQQKYIDEPKLEPRQKSKAELVADNSDWLIYTDENGHETHERSMYALTDNLLAYAEGPKKWGVKDIEDNIIIPAQFEELFVGGEDRFLIQTADQKNYGIIDIKGNWVIPFGKFDWLWWRGNCYLAEKDGKKGIIDLQGNVLIPFEYEYLHPSYDEGLDLISAKKDGEFFFINAKQEKIELF
jgi:hypothetical protein